MDVKNVPISNKTATLGSNITLKYLKNVLRPQGFGINFQGDTILCEKNDSFFRAAEMGKIIQEETK